MEAGDYNWVSLIDESLEHIHEQLDRYFHQFPWVQKSMDQWEIMIPIYAGYEKRNGYLAAQLFLHYDQSFDLASGGYLEDHSYWLYIRNFSNVEDKQMQPQEKAIQLLITTVDDLFQDGNLQISVSGI